MISAALCNQRADARMLEQEIRNEAAIHTDEKVSVRKLLNKKLMEEFLQNQGNMDFICIDVTIRQGIYYAELMREHYPEAALVLVAEAMRRRDMFELMQIPFEDVWNHLLEEEWITGRC